MNRQTLRNLLMMLAAAVNVTACAQTDGDSNNNGTCAIENSAVQYVMANSNATFSNTPGNIAQAYFDNTGLQRPDQPAGKTIHFKTREDKVIVSLTGGNAPAATVQTDTVSVDGGKGTFCFTNLLPETTYNYQVTTTQGTTLTQGQFRTKAGVRMIAVDGGFNVRDLGGWKGLGGRSVRYGWLYRGGSLGGTDKDGQRSYLPESGQKQLARLGIKAQLDLRAATNQGKYLNETSLHSYSAGVAPMDGMDFNNTMADGGAYNEDMSIISSVAWIIYELQHGRPVYFNCRQGADRTGTVAFIIEGLLGCNEYSTAAGANQLAFDYELTGFSQANLIDNLKVETSCRPAAEAYANGGKLFRKLLDLQAAETDIQLTNLQQQCYYYLNRYTNSNWQEPTLHIDSTDLDWFIRFMLGDMDETSYAAFRPTWAADGDDLKTVAEKKANVVTYKTGN